MPDANVSKAALLAALDRMSAQELTELIEAAEAKRRDKRETAKQELVDEFRARAAALGLSMDALLPRRQRAESGSASGRKQRSDAGSSRPAKYRGPNGEAWSGRGRTPRWLAALEAEGRGREQFAI
ncbi:MAG: H-NS histone family protein [Bryobacterales bacterium]|nr:H-NS histone family protein [Bryobacterales bacterium]